MAKKVLDDSGVLYLMHRINDNFVKKDGSKVLTDVNFSSTDKTKLDGLANIKSVGNGLTLNSSTGALTANVINNLTSTSTASALSAAQGKALDDKITTVSSKANAAYVKPSTGIPKTDLETAVQTSLGKADTALQASDITGKQNTLVSGTNIKTIGSQSLLGSGNLTVANIGAAAASHTHTQANVTGLTDALAAKQATLVSGTNIKSINNQSLLGSGNLTVANIGAAAASHTHTQANVTGLTDALNGKVNTSSIGVANGVASLGADGKVPSTQLPSYVDDAKVGYATITYNTAGTAITSVVFYSDSTKTAQIQGEEDKIYVDIITNYSFRWSPVSGNTAGLYTLITSADVVPITNAEIDTLVTTAGWSTT